MGQENPKIKEFTDLISWQRAHFLTLEIYKVTQKFPKEELFGITSQIRRSAASVPANIAEGFGRSTFKDRANFYTHANGSITEVKNHLLLAKDLKYISQSDFDRIYLLTTDAHKVLQGLLRRTREFSDISLS